MSGTDIGYAPKRGHSTRGTYAMSGSDIGYASSRFHTEVSTVPYTQVCSSIRAELVPDRMAMRTYHHGYARTHPGRMMLPARVMAHATFRNMVSAALSAYAMSCTELAFEGMRGHVRSSAVLP
eukprot:992775-Rhodomonas_salina.4